MIVDRSRDAAGRYAARPALTRFLEMVGPEPWAGGCWFWTGALLPITTRGGGYAQFWDGSRSVMAHRWSYEHFVGPIPDGKQLDHFVCDTPWCVNPFHVRPATGRENVLRGDGFAARNLAKTHCPLGHPYDDQNTYHRPDGGRDCKVCVNRRSRERNARRRAA